MAKNKGKKEDELIEEEELLEDEDQVIEEKAEKSQSLLEEELKRKEYELKETNIQLMRLQADFANFRKRTEKEKTDIINYALEEFICKLLPVVDNFQIAMEVEEKGEGSFYKGIELINKQLKDSLESNGVNEIASLGEEFDPNIHHAVFMEESEEYDSGKVVEVLQKGYMLKDKVIRPAMVKVAK